MAAWTVKSSWAKALSIRRDKTMQNIFRRFLGRLSDQGARRAPVEHAEEIQVLVPEAVRLPLPKRPQEEISVPASINGRDLSTGRL